MRRFLLRGAGLVLGACTIGPIDMPVMIPSPPGMAKLEQPETAVAQVRPQARPDSPAVAPARGDLGQTVASLGNPAEPGLWLRTPLVAQEQPGTVSLGGARVSVTLIPIEGPPTAGSRMSLEAFQALGAPLTDLPEVSVSAG